MVPTSFKRHPAWHITSGIRKAPPISTNSPRETTTSLSGATVASINKTAAALLLTIQASSAPVNSHNRSAMARSRCPREAPSREYSNVAGERMTWLTASIADSAINARPKLVCNTVPVKLKTGFMAAFRCNAIRFFNSSAQLSCHNYQLKLECQPDGANCLSMTVDCKVNAYHVSC